MGHATADDMVEHFDASTECLDKNKLICKYLWTDQM